ncbi:hypothetical protein NIES25_52540 [Nostoc linckia NIES-25]|nr:hypothetical protein NIES25_52540 [Nostoc linckia NIES-25]
MNIFHEKIQVFGKPKIALIKADIELSKQSNLFKFVLLLSSLRLYPSLYLRFWFARASKK